ncbi:hypothetical protein DAI22_02g057650 [Oryza sativa Japonica Group]|nr:hypothetical protein DAI22_02g057650 [Oryza sativa Japonica Group]
MDEEEEKKKKNKQMDQEDGTKKMKLTKETKLPGTISAAETTKDIKLQTKKKEPIQIKVAGHEAVQDVQKKKAKNQIRAILWQNILKKPKFRTPKLFQIRMALLLQYSCKIFQDTIETL